LANAKALIFCGHFFESAEAEEWASLGTRIITKELEEQILADGGHFELSPMYHSLILQDFLDLINLLRSSRKHRVGETFQIVECDLRDRLERAVPGMLNWLDFMSHPDGDISFFNDAAFDVAPKYSELLSYAARLEIERADTEYSRLSRLENSGYIRIADDRIYALIDVASIGPDYLPGHAHADTLSFELSLFEQRVFVNSGTSVYDPGETRLYERGTLAHNTVAIDGQNSSEVWSSFRVGRRAGILGLEIATQEPIKVVSSHDGYRRIEGSPVHQRTWVCFDRSLEILDSVSGDVQNAFSYFHIHPATTLIPGSDSVRLLLTSGEEALFRVLKGEFQIVADTWRSRFGERVDTSMIVVKLESNTSLVSISW
jgi:uncharacterized heparinase superfamily protein